MARPPGAGPRPLPAPEDGLVASQRPESRLGRLWRANLDALESTHADALAHARGLVRGRVRALAFAPGLVDAEVVDVAVELVTLRVRTLDQHERLVIARLLASRLDWLAALLEGELPEALLDALDAQAISLLPRWTHRHEDETGRRTRDMEGDCSCEHAWMLPCGHLAALHRVLADVLDGDPMLLLLLRGLDAAPLMAQLRSAWGDDSPTAPSAPLAEPPAGDFWSCPAPIPPVAFRGPDRSPMPGLTALGPAPEAADLEHALGPLYAAGAAAAEALAALTAVLPPIPPGPPAGEDPPEAQPDLTERLVERLADGEAHTTEALASALSLPPTEVLAELRALDALGMVTSHGRGARRRWSLA